MKTCYFLRQPTVTLAYVWVHGDPVYGPLAHRFVERYQKFPPGYKHDTVIICNGSFPSDPYLLKLFQNMLPRVTFFYHDNEGWDIGAYLKLARITSSDLLLCCGSHTYFKHAGWLDRLMQVWAQRGPGLYGTLASFEVRPHLNTSGFACPPALLRSCLTMPRSKFDRYEFEHGPNSITISALRYRLPVRLVTWDGDYAWPEWRQPPDIFRRGDQSNCLSFFRCTDEYEHASPKDKLKLARLADTPSYDSLEQVRLATAANLS